MKDAYVEDLTRGGWCVQSCSQCMLILCCTKYRGKVRGSFTINSELCSFLSLFSLFILVIRVTPTFFLGLSPRHYFSMFQFSILERYKWRLLHSRKSLSIFRCRVVYFFKIVIGSFFFFFCFILTSFCRQKSSLPYLMIKHYIHMELVCGVGLFSIVLCCLVGSIEPYWVGTQTKKKKKKLSFSSTA